MQVQWSGDGGNQDVESEDKTFASYNWSIRDIEEGIRSEPSTAPWSLDGHRSTEGHNNEHCTHHLVNAGVNRFDFLLRSGLTSRPPANNE
jgi:hypothetical protein